MTPEQKKWIDDASAEQLLRKLRYASPKDAFFQDECGDYYLKIIRQRRSADPEGWMQASKNIGW